jgi:hypothetical protein
MPILAQLLIFILFDFCCGGIIKPISNQLISIRMKTIKKQIIRILSLIMVCILSSNLHAQKGVNQKKGFLRVYNLEGKKISKGKIAFINDSILGLTKAGELVEIKVTEIGRIKTKRSGGHNLLVGSLVGGGLLAIIVGASSKEETKTVNGGWLFGEFEYTSGISPSSGAAIGGVIGLTGGAAIGGITSVFKNSKTFIINGDIKKWFIFKETIDSVRHK